MDNSRLDEIIVECIERIIGEESSISSYVVSMTKHYCGIISKKLSLGDFDGYSKLVISVDDADGGRFVKRISYKTLSVPADYKACDAFDCLDRIIVRVYDFEGKNDLQAYFEDCEIGGTSLVHNGVITINGYSVNGKLNIPSINVTLQHELEHFLQIGYGKSVGNNERLRIASNSLSSNKNSCEYIIARLFYFFSQAEIDAKMHELYIDIRKQQISSPVYLKRCFVIREKNKHLELLNKLLNEFTDEAVANELSKYKETKKSFLSYIDRQIHYFDRKTWKVMMQYFNEIENVRLKKRVREE